MSGGNAIVGAVKMNRRHAAVQRGQVESTFMTGEGKIGRPELMREVISAVRPDSVMVMIAVTPFRWFAAYIADMAIASSTLSN